MRRRVQPGPGFWLAASAALCMAAGVILIAALQRPAGVDLDKFATPAPDPPATEESQAEAEAEESTPPAEPSEIAVEHPPPGDPETPPAPAQTPHATPTPPPPDPPGIDWAWVTTRSDLWPKTTVLLRPVDFPLLIDGEIKGTVKVHAGSEVRVVSIVGDRVTLSHGDSTAEVEVGATTLEEYFRGVDPSEPETAHFVEPPAAPESTAPDSPAALSPAPNWEKLPGADRLSTEELLKILRPFSSPSPRLEVGSFPEIFGGVTLLMPLADALEKLGFRWAVIPARTPISHPAIPFFYRSFDFRPSPASPLFAEGINVFNRLYLITDAADRAVAIQLVCETPKHYREPNSDFVTYNFILNRRKTATILRVGYLAESRGDRLVIETWLSDERRQNTREDSRLYLPRHAADLIRHVIEVRLLSPSGG